MRKKIYIVLSMAFTLTFFCIQPGFAARDPQSEADIAPIPPEQTVDIDEIEILEDGSTIRTVIPGNVERSSFQVGGGTNQLMNPSKLGGKLPGGLTFLNSIAIQNGYGVDKHVLPDPAYFEITFSQPQIERGLKILYWERQQWKEVAKGTLKIKTHALGDYVLATDVVPTKEGAGKSYILDDGTQVIVSVPEESLPEGTEKFETTVTRLRKDKLPGEINGTFLNAVNLAASIDGAALPTLPADGLLGLTFARQPNTKNLRILYWQANGWKEVAAEKLQLVSRQLGTYALVSAP